MSRYAYPNPGEAEAKLKQALALFDLFQDIPDPAAKIARLRDIEAQYAVLRDAAKRVLEDPCDDNGETLDAHAELERAVYPTDERAKTAVDELGRLRKVEVIAEELAGDLSKMYDELIRIRRIRLATNPGALESEKARADAAEAELTKLRTVYAAAVQECRMARAALGHNTALSLRHDAARAEAGMENL